MLDTVLTTYQYDTNIPGDAAAYAALREQLKDHPHRMRSIGEHYEAGVKAGTQVKLSTEYLFNNQWNATVAGDRQVRLFDWAEDVVFRGNVEYRNIRRGYWLMQTDAMRSIRLHTVKCGYCGAIQPADGTEFCPACRGSRHLRVDELHLTRLLPVYTDFATTRPPLTEAEAAMLRPLYETAQAVRRQADGVKKRLSIVKDFEATVATATVKRDGLLWLVDRNLETDNAIYYSHTGRWGFGWREPLAEEPAAQLRAALEHFPFPFDIKTR